MNNFKVPADLIERKTYIEKAEPFIRKPVVKVLTGQRRAGKSYIMYQIMAHILNEDPESVIIYINKEDTRFDFINTYSDLEGYIKSQTEKGKLNYVFIDEVQEIGEFEKAIRSLLRDGIYDIYITGSNAGLLSGEFATLLGGRSVKFRVSGLSYSEFLLFHRLTDSDESLARYMLHGGLPFLVNLKSGHEVVFEYLRNIYNTIVLRDVVSRHRLRNIYFLERLIRFLADNTGSLFSAKSISDFLKAQKIMIPHNQVQAYVRYLSDAFLIKGVMRYDISGKRLFETGEKYYFSDTGIRNVITGYKPGDRAKVVEYIVFNELLYRNYDVTTGWKGSNEIDFVAVKNNETRYIQVALVLDNRQTVSREFGNLLKINDNYPKMVVSTDAGYRNTVDGIKHVNLRDFLLGDW
jgi:predicted AAA+ superfamily ATPase